MAEIGRLNELRVVKEVGFGLYLDGGELGEILLPLRYVPEDCKVDDMLEVFIYLDSEDRIIATTEKPFAMVNDFALLKVVAVNSAGAFLDWGLPKDLLVPYSEQRPVMKEGESYVVRIYLDLNSNRLAASSKLDKFLNNEPGDLKPGQEVDLLICEQTDLGWKAIINNSYWGVLYDNEIFQPLNKGQKIKGFIKKIRDDKKIDLCLQKPGYEKVDDISETIITALKEQGGFIPVTDKSSPEIIYKLFGISKKTYKKAIGAIYKKKLITIENDGIKLVNKGSAK
ncbi:MAG: S1-like domain-containing RNA-binding protein [Thermodesulfovibrionia bacterium]|nr:S1-like domain-containing RNA-binding protein [Thermodesulfovibrionia bacterium]